MYKGRKRQNTKLLKPSIPTYEGEGCQFEIYSKTLNGMCPCGKELHNIGKLIYNVCTEHYDYMTALGYKAKEKKK